MSRLYAHPVRVGVDPTGVPTSVRWRGRTYQVGEVLGRWVEAAVWWPAARAAVTAPGPVTVQGPVTEPPSEWVVWRVEAHRGRATAVMDLWQGSDGWRVHAIAD